jgi:hypothetical protein
MNCVFFAHFHTFWFRLADSTDYRRTQYWNTAKHATTHKNGRVSIGPLPGRYGGRYYTMEHKYGSKSTLGEWSVLGRSGIFAQNDRSATLGRLRYRCTPFSSRCNFVATVFLQTREQYILGASFCRNKNISAEVYVGTYL